MKFLNRLNYECNAIGSKEQQGRVTDMPLVKVKRFAQMTLPAAVRKQFQISEGDYLEAEAVEVGILLKPVAVVERKRARRICSRSLTESKSECRSLLARPRNRRKRRLLR